MEEELNYASMVFKNGHRAPKENNEEPTIYSTVKPQGAATPEPNGEAAAHTQGSHLLLVCLGILCVLLVASISVIIYITTVVMTTQKANEEMATLNANLSAENQQLITQRSIMENRTEELSRDRDDLNRMLSIIMKFETFPVNKFCSDKECQPCQSGWIHFQGSCYLFYKQSLWMTWGNSRKHCQQSAADLVVIDSLQEQEFLRINSKYYYDKYHGYWIGLQQTADENWVWVDGHNDSLGYWLEERLGTAGPCALLIPKRNSETSWDPAECEMVNKFICETEALIWPKQLP